LDERSFSHKYANKFDEVYISTTTFMYLTNIAKNQTRFKIKVTARTETNVLRERPELKGIAEVHV
jgi:hypothetical protein